MFLDKWVFIGILLDNTKPERERETSILPCLLLFKSLAFAVLPDDPFLTYDASARNISIYLLLGQTRRDPRGCSNEISNSPWKLGRHWKWIERANNAEQGGWRALRWSGGATSGVGTCVVTFVPAMVDEVQTATSWSALRRTYGTRFYGTHERCSERPR